MRNRSPDLTKQRRMLRIAPPAAGVRANATMLCAAVLGWAAGLSGGKFGQHQTRGIQGGLLVLIYAGRLLVDRRVHTRPGRSCG